MPHQVPVFELRPARVMLRFATVRLTPFFGLLLLGCVLLGIASSAQAQEFIRLDHVGAGSFKSQGFTLSQPTEIEMQARGVSPSLTDSFVVAAWVFDRDQGRALWRLGGDTARQGSSSYLFEAVETWALPAGNYELYLAAVPESRIKVRSGLLTTLFEGKQSQEDKTDAIRAVYDAAFVALSTPNANDISTYTVGSHEHDDALVRFDQAGDRAYLRQSFETDVPTRVRLRVLLEVPPQSRRPTDLAWIEDDSGVRVFETDRFNTDRAGGHPKNRIFDGDVELAAGSYTLCFASDQHHSAEGFDAMPPYDPSGWGVVMLPVTGFDPSTFRLIESQVRTPLVDLTRAGDNVVLEQAFRLGTLSSLDIDAMGEFGRRSDRFVDRGWILDATTGETMWEMTRRETEYAGGSRSNRRFKGTIQLPAGDYLAIFTTDGSHAYNDFRGAPYEPDAWGMALYEGDAFDRASFEMLSVEELPQPEGMLARIVRAGNDLDESALFTLTDATRVRIYAIGEGSRGNMFDYGELRNAATRETIWKMRYDDTDHAGGASKNRVVEHQLDLPAGEYEAIYKSDGSHAFGTWNAPQPDDGLNYGLTIVRQPDQATP